MVSRISRIFRQARILKEDADGDSPKPCEETRDLVPSVNIPAWGNSGSRNIGRIRSTAAMTFRGLFTFSVTCDIWGQRWR